MLLSAAGLTAADRQTAENTVTLSAVVLDRSGIPVRNLTAADFRVTENGKVMPISAVRSVTVGDATARGRHVVLVLGASGTAPQLTSRVQLVADGFFKAAGANDTVSVVRWGTKDQIDGTRQTMEARVAEYRAGAGEPLNMRTGRDVLDTVARLADAFQGDSAERRAIVFIGSPFVYDVIQPQQIDYALSGPNWTRALAATARANASVYIIDPHGLQGAIRINPDGLVAQTGGTVFYNRNDIEHAMDTIWRDSSTYYSIEYEPMPGKRQLQTIRVQVERPDVTVRARRSR